MLKRKKRTRVSRKGQGGAGIGTGIGTGKKPTLAINSIFAFIFLCLLLTACNKSGEEAYKKGEELWEAKKYSDALIQYEKAVSENPKGHLAKDALYQIGNIYYLNLRDYQKALDAYRKLVDTSPGSHFSADAQRRIAEIYREKFGDLKGAITEYQRFVKVFPKEADRARYSMAECYILLKEFDKAREQYENILKETPDIDYKDDVLYQIANSYYLEGKTSEAKKGFEELVEKFPETKFLADARFGIALAFEEEGNLQEALTRLTQLRGIYHDQRVLDLRIRGIQERMEAKKKPSQRKR